MNRLTPQEIADKLRKCANGGGCDSCPYKCGEGIADFSCINSLMYAAADAIDNQRAHIQALIKANEAHREERAAYARRRRQENPGLVAADNAYYKKKRRLAEVEAR